MTVSNIGRVPRTNVLNSRNTLIVDVESRLSEYRRILTKQRTHAGVHSELWECLFLADLYCIGARLLKSNVSKEFMDIIAVETIFFIEVTIE